MCFYYRYQVLGMRPLTTTTTKGTHPFDNGSFGLDADNVLCKLTPTGVWRPCIGTVALPHVIGLTHMGHLGAKATFDRFCAVAYAPHLLHHVEAFVKRCTQCQQMRMLLHQPYGALQLLPAPDTPFTTISCDFRLHHVERRKVEPMVRQTATVPHWMAKEDH
uniref:Integrase zinc-binding domain-containing protein n=1 Tax=Ustilago hordei TaxID=120017 RepID=Q2A765_USTHO|nr:hypothetical protein UHO_0068 [Ustilago hordei]